MTSPALLKSALPDANVTWQPMGELGYLVRGNGLQKKDFVDVGIPAIHYGQIYTYYGLSTKKTKSFVSPELAKTLRKVDKGDVVITNTSENVEDVGKALVYLGDRQAVTGGHATVFKPGKNIIGKYLAYYTQTAVFDDYKRKFAKGAKVIDVSATDLAKIPVPIPHPEDPEKSLAIQAEIVRILDTFSGMTAALTEELHAREKQYIHYRDKLFSATESKMGWKTLGDIGSVKMCKRILKNETDNEGDVPFYKIGTFGKEADAFIPKDLYDEYRARYSFPKEGDVLISASGTIGRAVVYDGKPAYFQDSNIVWIDNDERIVSNRYLWHFYKIAKWFVSSGGTIARLYNDNILRTKIPVPFADDPERSLGEQARIVAILDKFETIAKSSQKGLPREIDLRQKQYAYYRDLLLSFPKLEEMAT